MTRVDRPAFDALVSQLSAARGRKLDEEGRDGLWLLVEDLTWEQFSLGLIEAARTSRYWPSPADIRAAVAAQERQAAPQATVRLAAYQESRCCTWCDDTGWQARDRLTRAPLRPDTVVGRSHAERYVVSCACRATNPVYQAKRAAARPARQELS